MPHDPLVSTGATPERHRNDALLYRLEHVGLDPVSRLLARANGGSGFGEHRWVSFGERRGLVSAEADVVAALLRSSRRPVAMDDGDV